MDTAQIAKISKALADRTRLDIYQAIAARPDVYCGEILERYDLAPGTLSHHLKTLVEAELIQCRRQGQFVHSRVRGETMREYTQALAGLARAGAKKHRERK